MSVHPQWRKTYEAEPLMIEPEWLPTVENINRLPAPLQSFIHAILAEADYAFTSQENFALRTQNEQLRALVREVKT